MSCRCSCTTAVEGIREVRTPELTWIQVNEEIPCERFSYSQRSRIIDDVMMFNTRTEMNDFIDARD